MENVFANYSNQLWKEKELIIILNNDKINPKKWQEKALHYNNVSIFQIPQTKTLGQCLNYGVAKAKYDIIAKFDDDDYYSPYYLTEAMAAFRKHRPELVGKGSTFIYFEKGSILAKRKIGTENRLGKSFIFGGTIMFKKSLWKKIKFPSIKGAGTDQAFLRKCKIRNIRTYTTSKFNYVYIRRRNPRSHTFKKLNLYIKRKSRIIGRIRNFKRIVTKNIGT